MGRTEGKDLSTGSNAVATTLSSGDIEIYLHDTHLYIRRGEESMYRQSFIVAFLVAETLFGAVASCQMVPIYKLAAQLQLSPAANVIANKADLGT